MHAVTIGAKNATVKAIEQRIQFVGSKEGKILALREMIRKGVAPPVLVFTEVRPMRCLLSVTIHDQALVIFLAVLMGSP